MQNIEFIILTLYQQVDSVQLLISSPPIDFKNKTLKKFPVFLMQNMELIILTLTQFNN